MSGNIELTSRDQYYLAAADSLRAAGFKDAASYLESLVWGSRQRKGETKEDTAEMAPLDWPRWEEWVKRKHYPKVAKDVRPPRMGDSVFGR